MTNNSEVKLDYNKILDDYKKKKKIYDIIINNKEVSNNLKLTNGDEFVESLCYNIKKINEQKSYTTLNEEAQQYRINRKIHVIDKLLPDKINKTFKYLDLGCNDGSLTRGISKYYNFDSDNIYGIDIPEWGGVKIDCKIKNMYYINEKEPKLPYADNFFDLITCFMVLHHNYNVTYMISELKRVLKKGGYIIINEHDMNNYINKQVIDFQHLKYMCTETDNIEPDKYIGNYKNMREWNKLFNLKIIKYTKPTGITRSYYIVYQK